MWPGPRGQGLQCGWNEVHNAVRNDYNAVRNESGQCGLAPQWTMCSGSTLDTAVRYDGEQRGPGRWLTVRSGLMVDHAVRDHGDNAAREHGGNAVRDDGLQCRPEGRWTMRPATRWSKQSGARWATRSCHAVDNAVRDDGLQCGPE